MLYSALYISLVKMVVSYFECVPNPAADATLAKYKQVVCHSSEHSVATPAMVLGMVLYVFGFFCLCLYMNVKAPELFVHKRIRVRCKFLVNRWRADTWYFGSVYMVRNLILALVGVISSTAVDQFAMMGVIMIVFLVGSLQVTPWKSIRLAQFDATISCIVIFATICGTVFTHYSVSVAYFEGDDSEVAAKVDAETRTAVFRNLLLASMGVAALLFVLLVCYCVWWMKNTVTLTADAAKANAHLVERFQVTIRHEHFLEEFKRLIATGTYHDIDSLNSFLDNLQARLAGSESWREKHPSWRSNTHVRMLLESVKPPVSTSADEKKAADAAVTEV
jgi:hypothetical protein